MTRQRQLNFNLQFLLLVFAGWINRHQQAVIDYLHVENQSLREQLGKKRLRWTDAPRRRLAEKAKAVGRSALTALGTVVTPDTLFRWYRNLVAAKYDGSKKRSPGRPRRKPDTTKLVIRMARENSSWGYTRIKGALYNLGHDVARNTVKEILRERGIEPAPERRRHPSWHVFIKSHLGAIAGADFFTVEVLRGNTNGAQGRVQRRERVGGLLNFYCRDAAGFGSIKFSHQTRCTSDAVRPSPMSWPREDEMRAGGA